MSLISNIFAFAGSINKHNNMKYEYLIKGISSNSKLCNYHKYLFLSQRSFNPTHAALTVEWSRKSRAVEEQPQKTHKPIPQRGEPTVPRLTMREEGKNGGAEEII